MTAQNWKLMPTDPALALDLGWAYLDAAAEAEPNKKWSFSHAGYRAMIAAAPQPPALGGEPEVIYMLRNTALNAPWRDADKAAFDCAAGLAEYERRELVDRAHFVRLHAEVERMKAGIEGYESGEHAAQVADTLGHQLAQAQARNAALEGLLRELTNEPFLNPARLKRIDAALAEGAKS